jgi:hypothetical protein
LALQVPGLTERQQQQQQQQQAPWGGLQQSGKALFVLDSTVCASS